jgi:pilus assembly protein CpaB
MGRWRAVVPIVLALVVAVVASFLLYKWMKKQTAPKKVAEVKTVQVVVAEVDLHPGMKLKSEMMKTVSYLEESLPAGHLLTPEKAAGRVVISPMKRQELILESRLAPATVKKGGMAAIITPGKRAVSIAGNKVLGSSGLINPGDHVDILLTADGKNKTVFENVLVLATGPRLRRNPEGKPSPVKVYTLEVTPEQGERLTVASNKGRLQFALRGAMDSEVVLTKGITVPELLDAYVLTGPKPVPVVVQPPTDTSMAIPITLKKKFVPHRKKTKITVEMIKGLSLSKKTLKIY